MVRRSLALLYMEYRPSEIADILDISVQTIYATYLPAGLPHRRDEHGHIWIVGTEFYSWVQDIAEKSQKDPKKPMKPNEAYCLSCRERVKIANMKRSKAVNKQVTRVSGECPICGTKVSRFCRYTEAGQ